MKDDNFLNFNGVFDQVNHNNNLEKAIKRLQSLMESEILNKQKTIELLQSEVEGLRKELSTEIEKAREYEIKMQQARQSAEGSRQLVNKLLNDMERMQQDIGWYKRTYENRSILGTIREKLIKSKNSK